MFVVGSFPVGDLHPKMTKKGRPKSGSISVLGVHSPMLLKRLADPLCKDSNSKINKVAGLRPWGSTTEARANTCDLALAGQGGPSRGRGRPDCKNTAFGSRGGCEPGAGRGRAGRFHFPTHSPQLARASREPYCEGMNLLRTTTILLPNAIA